MPRLNDADYPDLLRQITDPPAQLFVRGTLPQSPMVAVVGSRRATPYGLRVAYDLAAALVSAGITVVSGLARGIDASAHRGALAGSGTTVAVLATGLDCIYPPEHAQLAEDIAGHGALVTEAPPGTAPLPGRFPVRNRIISGLSLGVVVVEAAQRSGALITARLALEQGREVFAIPGSIENPLTVGPHALIQDGAKLVAGVEDILDEFPNVSRARARVSAHTYAHARADSGPQDPELKAVWTLLDLDRPRHHGELAEMLGLQVQEVSRRLTLLEMGNYIIGVSDGAIVRRGPTTDEWQTH